MQRIAVIVIIFIVLVTGIAQAGKIGDAIEKDDLAKVKALIEKNPGLVKAKDQFGITPIYYTLIFGRKKIAQFLISKGAPNNIHTAALIGDLETVKSLIKKRPKLLKKTINLTSVNASLMPIHYAARGGNKEVIQYLIKRGANVNDTNPVCGTTVLCEAIEGGHNELVKWLISKGSEIEGSTGVRWRTALQLSIVKDNRYLIKYLIDQGAKIDAKDRNDNTSLHLAVEGGQSEIVELLISKGANINAKNYYQETPLHIAARRGNKNITRILIFKEVKINERDFKGRTPLSLAKEWKQKETADFLRKNGAKE